VRNIAVEGVAVARSNRGAGSSDVPGDRHPGVVKHGDEIRGESRSQREKEREQKKALVEPGLHGTEGGDVSGVSGPGGPVFFWTGWSQAGGM
jgi:hypothetical protein